MGDEGKAHYASLKAKLKAARQRLDDLADDTGEYNNQMNHIEREFTWWSDKVSTAGCDEDWEADLPSWNEVYTHICRPGTAATPSKSTDTTFVTTQLTVEC